MYKKSKTRLEELQDARDNAVGNDDEYARCQKDIDVHFFGTPTKKVKKPKRVFNYSDEDYDEWDDYDY